jgi:MFS family permease
MFAVGIFAGRLARKLGGKVLVMAGCLIGAMSLAILAFAHAHEWEIFLSSAIMGVGFGLAFSAMSALIVAAVPAGQTGVASGMNANIRTIGGSIGAAVMASIVTSQLEPSGLPRESGYTTGFAVMAAGLVLAALAGVLIPSARGIRRDADGLEHAEVAQVAGGSLAGGSLAGGPLAGGSLAGGSLAGGTSE